MFRIISVAASATLLIAPCFSQQEDRRENPRRGVEREVDLEREEIERRKQRVIRAREEQAELAEREKATQAERRKHEAMDRYKRARVDYPAEFKERLMDLRNELGRVMRERPDSERAGELTEMIKHIERELLERREAEHKEREMDERERHEREMHEREMQEREEHVGDLERRIDQLKVAAEHLHAAGMHDLGEETEKRIERLSDEMRHHAERRPHHPEPGLHPKHAEMFEHLQRQMNELREHLHGLHEKMEHLHRER